MLGLLNQSRYNRPEPKDDTRSHESKKVRPIEEKESFRWLETLERSTQDIPEGGKVITVYDREGDMHELFDKAERLNQPFLIRAIQNRMTVENKRIRNRRRRGRVEVTIPRDSRSGITTAVCSVYDTAAAYSQSDKNAV